MDDELLIVFFFAAIGAVLGSFLNVCILRLPSEQSVVSPPSRCPKCGTGVKWYDNVPILSWLVLGGKCRTCKEPISGMYPIIELVVAVVWVWCAHRWGLSLESLQWAVFSTILIGIAMTDAREFIIPHEFSFGGLALGLGFAFAMGGEWPSAALGGACFGAGLVYLVGTMGRFVLQKEAMGGGDIALMAMIGCFLGWQSVLATIFLGAVVALVLTLIGRLLRPKSSVEVSEPAPLPRSPIDWWLFFVVLGGVVVSGFIGPLTVVTAVGTVLQGIGLSYLVRTSLGLVSRHLAGRDGDANLLAIGGAGLALLLGWAGISQLPAIWFVGAGLILFQIVLALFRPDVSDQGIEKSSVVDDAPPDVLEHLGYLPFGVSLALVALAIALLTGTRPINDWFQWYSQMVGF